MTHRTVYLTASQIRQLARDATICAAAVKLYVPAHQKRPLAAAERVLKRFVWRDVKRRRESR